MNVSRNKDIQKLQVLKNDSRQSAPAATDILLGTYNFKRVQAVCEDALNNRKLVSIVGDSGYGKSTALKYFQYTHKNVFYMTVKPSMSVKTFWESLFESLSHDERQYFGMDSKPRALYFIMRRAAELLKSYDSALLIIDEAGKFSARMFEFIHELRDETHSTTGIVLAGPPYFKANLLRWVKNERVGMPEVWRRINYWEHLLAPEKSEVKGFCQHYGVTDTDIIRKLIIECKNFGTLHNYLVEYLTGNMKL